MNPTTLGVPAIALAVSLGTASLWGADWPQWRGPARDGISAETGLLSSWPEGGPKLLWKTGELGNGYSSPIVVNETIYITGDVGEKLLITALDVDGSVRWRVQNGESWRKSYPGSRSAPTYDDGRIYHMNAHGRLVCLDAKTGKESWAVEVLERFEARNVTWGQSESILVHGSKVIVTPIGGKALLAALDKRTGETVWTTPALADEKVAYASPILVRRGGRALVVNAGSLHAFAADEETGKLLWKHRHPVPENVVGSTPVLVDDAVVITNSSREHSGAYLLRLNADGTEVEQVWVSDLKNGQGGLVLVGKRLYGANGRDSSDGVAVVDPKTGTIETIDTDLSFGAGAYADERIYYLSQLGDMALLEPTESGARVVGRFGLVKPRRKDAWAHPVISGGRLYLRYADALYCYDVRSH